MVVLKLRARSTAANAAVIVALVLGGISIPLIATIGGASALQENTETTEPTIIVSGDRVAEVDKPYKIDVSVEGLDEKDIASWTVAWGDGTVDTKQNKPGTINHNTKSSG